MSIDTIYRDDVEAGIQRQIANPRPAPGSSFSTVAMLAAGVKGVPAGALELGASIGESAAAVPEEDFEKRRRDAAGIPATDFAGLAAGARAKAADLAPDPTTSHVADQVLHGFTRVGTKVVAATAVAPLPAAGALLGAEGAQTAYQALRAKGVDHETAIKAAAVEGMGQAAAVIPMAGPTIKATVGLGIAAGPGTFMAQESLSRKILAQAGYNDEASRHDPLDPLGLTISTLLPAVFGGAHAYGLARASAKPAPSLADVVLGNESGGKRYGADGKLLTSPKGAQGEMQVMPGTASDPGYGVTPARDGSPDELARVGRDYLAAMSDRYGGAPDAAMAAYNAGPGAVDKAIAAHGSDWLAHMPDETKAYVAKGLKKLGDQTIEHASTDPVAVDAARVRTTQDALYRSLPDAPEAWGEVMHASDTIAAGDMPIVPPREVIRVPDVADEHIATLEPEHQGTLHDMYAAAAREKPAFDDALGAIAKDVGGEFMSASLKGTERATAKIRSDYGGDPSRIKDLLRATIQVDSAEGAMRAVASIFERFKVSEGGRRNLLDPGLQPVDGYRDAKFNVEINGHVAEVQINLPEMIAAKKEVHGLYAEREALDRQYKGKVIPPDVVAKIDDLNAQMRAVYEPAWVAATNASKAGSEIGAPLRRMDDGSNVRGGSVSQATEYGTPGASGLRDAGIPSTSNNSALGPKDGSFISTSEPIIQAAGAAAKREPPPFRGERAREIVKDSPDLRVQLPGSDETITVKEALARAEAEHTLDMSETNLVKAALECALSFGA